MHAMPDKTYGVTWQEDAGVPLAVVRGRWGAGQAYHPVFGWRLKVFAYLDGAIRLFSAERGSRFFNSAPSHRGARRASLQLGRSALGGEIELGDASR
jgi:hypothetical protein